MKTLITTLLLATCLTSPARAANPYTAMRAFGLLGTWDQNCTAPITDTMLLTRFTMTSLGEPRIIISHPDDIIYESTITAATLIPPDEIELTVTGGFTAPPQQLIFRHTGAALQLTFASTPPLYRCISE